MYKKKNLEKTTNTFQFVYDNVYDMLSYIRLEEKKALVVGLNEIAVDLKSVPFWSASSSLAEGTTR